MAIAWAETFTHHCEWSATCLSPINQSIMKHGATYSSSMPSWTAHAHNPASPYTLVDTRHAEQKQRKNYTRHNPCSIIKIAMRFHISCLQKYLTRRYSEPPSRADFQTTNHKWTECQRRTRNTGDEISGGSWFCFLLLSWPGDWARSPSSYPSSERERSMNVTWMT